MRVMLWVNHLGTTRSRNLVDRIRPDLKIRTTIDPHRIGLSDPIKSNLRMRNRVTIGEIGMTGITSIE